MEVKGSTVVTWKTLAARKNAAFSVAAISGNDHRALHLRRRVENWMSRAALSHDMRVEISS